MSQSPALARPPSRAASHTSRVSVVSRGAVSMYSVGSVHSVRSVAARSQAGFTEHEPWRPPVLSRAFCTSIPRAAHHTAVYALIQSLFTIITGGFDMYVLAEAEPGKDHFGYYLISFDFVYAGNEHVRRSLMVVALISTLIGIFLLAFSVVLLRALLTENERRFRPWLLVMFVHTCWHAVAVVFTSLVNDLYFTYHGLVCFLWAVMVPLNVYCWLVVWSLFTELAEVSRLEDIAHLKTGTMTSLSGLPYSHTPSVSVNPHSRPITPLDYRL